ncbi:MAG: DUF4838 domain-containing protein [Clostridia bacterium]|nr:DUF4838 domain-containing protein [Clostridia bacterium]
MRKLIVKGKEITAVKYLPGDSAPEQNAAKELAAYLGKIAGITDDGEFPVVLKAVDDITRDGFKVEVTEDGITILGGGGSGVLHGVYEFLEHYAGVRFFTPTLETYGIGDIIVDEDYAYTPVFEYRQSDWQCGNDIMWSLKNGINNRPIPEEWGGYIRYGAFVHTMQTFLGIPQHEQPCLSDPANLEKVIAGVRNILAKDPGCTIISVSQNDCQNYCKCEKCAAVDAEEGSHMGTLLRFVNAVADNIKEDYPHVIIDTLAYQYTRNVPKITKPRENVCIRLCSIECCFCHPLDDITCDQNHRFYKDIVDWNQICDRIYIWDYVTDFAHYVPTFPNFGVLRENMQFFAKHHVRGMYPEGAHNAPVSGEFAELRAYLLARLMWDPYMSSVKYHKYMDEFLAAYYGEGWRYIRAYIDLMGSFTQERHMGIFEKPFNYLDESKVAAMEDTLDSLWDKAEAMAGDSLDYVKRSRIQWRWMKLELHPDAEEGRKLYAECAERNIKWNEWRVIDADRVNFGLKPSVWADASMWHMG